MKYGGTEGAAEFMHRSSGNYRIEQTSSKS